MIPGPNIRRVQIDLAAHNGGRHVAQALIRPSGKASKLGERVRHLEMEPFREDPLRLFNRNPAVEGLLELST